MNSTELRDIVLAFDGKRLLVRTDVDEVVDFVTSSHEAMITETDGTPDRVMQITRTADGYSLDSYFFNGSGSAAFLFDLIRLRIASAFIEMRPDLLWIHSGVVAKEGQALLIVGASGQGKSTLVTILHAQGWVFLSDEMAPIDVAKGFVLPYPRTPVRRIPVANELDPLHVSGLPKESYAPQRDSISTAAVRIGAVVFPRFSHGGDTVIKKLSAGDASIELMRSCTNFSDHKAEAVTALAQLASRVPSWVVTYSDGHDAANVLHRLEDRIFIKS